MTSKERKLFEKSEDFFKVMCTVGNELKTQKRCLDDVKKHIEKELTLWFKQEANKDSIEDNILKQYIFSYLSWIL